MSFTQKAKCATKAEHNLAIKIK